MAVSPRLLQVAARIDRYVDLIPSRYYLNENQQNAVKDEDPKKKKRACYDPAVRKTTSQLLAEAGKAASTQSVASGSKKKKAKKQKLNESSGGDNGLSRNELREKLQLRISELKEERRRRQSEKDKAKAKAGRGQMPETGESRKRKEVAVGKNTVVEDDVEAGKVDFEAQAADMPFEATINARGTKGRRLHQAIREEEARKKKIAAAAGDAEAEEAINNEVRMQRALARARGEKVHDDVSRLRKSQKLAEKKKKKSKEKWNARLDTVDKAMKEKQQTRKDNIAKKVASKKKNQRGFEGKVEGYLNKD